MKKATLFSMLLLLATCLTAQESITLKFTAKTQSNAYAQFEAVNVTNVTRGWSETLYYPDTTLVLTFFDGVNEHEGFQMAAYPNPFNGTTQVLFGTENAEQIDVKVVNIAGETLADYQGSVGAGTHQITVSLAQPQLAFVVVSTSEGQFVQKIVNAGQGTGNAIAMSQVDYGKGDQPARKTRAVGDFELGDMMSYEAVAASGNSEVITQQQYESETIELVFPDTGPTGIINGLFSVASGRKVYFSQGNLQYQASTGTWRFAADQYEYLGEENANISPTYDGWIDLFGWGTSGWDNGNVYYQPWDSINADGSLYGPPGTHNLTGSYANSDWGWYNAISNGGNQPNQWRTLLKDEWIYLLEDRPGNRFAKANVAEVDGLILLPDDWNSNNYDLNGMNDAWSGFASNVIDVATWVTVFETNGAVFLPVTGMRTGGTPSGFGGGCYWSATTEDVDIASYVYIHDVFIWTSSANYRRAGKAVRLVCPAQ